MNDIAAYSPEEYLLPFWKGDRVYAETIFVSENALGEVRPFRLAFPVRRVISVRSGDFRVTYAENEDYRVNEYGELEIVRGGRIPVLKWSEYRFREHDAARGDRMASADALGAWRACDLFAEEEGMRAWQLAVSYEHEESGLYAVTKGKRSRLPRLARLLDGHESIRVVGYGDSITYGWAASGMCDIRKPPFCKPYAGMVCDGLRLAGAADVHFVNCSVSGKCTDWAAKEENLARVTACAPDLVILAFGMNDGGVFRPEVFSANLRTIVAHIRAACPQTEFLLVTPILPNPLVAFRAGSSVFRYHGEYPRAAAAIEADTAGVAHADVTAVHRLLLERKNVQDMLSNNINHPNDFMHRVYAQVALQTLLGD